MDMTEDMAVYLANSFRDPDYEARKMQGKWVVWCHASDHVVEFDKLSLDLAKEFVER